MTTRISRINLKNELCKADVSMKELSEKSGIAYSTLAGIATGRSCRKKTAEAIADALNVPLSKILEKK